MTSGDTLTSVISTGHKHIIDYRCHFPRTGRCWLLPNDISSFLYRACFVLIIHWSSAMIHFYKTQADIISSTDGTLRLKVFLICLYLRILQLQIWHQTLGHDSKGHLIVSYSRYLASFSFKVISFQNYILKKVSTTLFKMMYNVMWHLNVTWINLVKLRNLGII